MGSHRTERRNASGAVAKLRSIAKAAAARGDHGKAQRIKANNLGTVKKHRQVHAWKMRVRDVTYRAVHAVADKARVIVAEDLTRGFSSGRKLDRDTNRRLAA